MRTRIVNEQLRAVDKPPLRNAGPLIAFVIFFAVGFVVGLLAIDFYIVTRNNRAQRRITAAPPHTDG